MATDQKEVLEPTAGLSSASCCVKLHVVDHSEEKDDEGTKEQKEINHCQFFHPVFTHQVFGMKEHIQGYQPYPFALPSQITAQHHPSFQYHNGATSLIQIDIHLAPSCNSCIIHIRHEPKEEEEEEEEGGGVINSSVATSDQIISSTGIKRKFSTTIHQQHQQHQQHRQHQQHHQHQQHQQQHQQKQQENKIAHNHNHEPIASHTSSS